MKVITTRDLIKEKIADYKLYLSRKPQGGAKVSLRQALDQVDPETVTQEHLMQLSKEHRAKSLGKYLTLSCDQCGEDVERVVEIEALRTVGDDTSYTTSHLCQRCIDAAAALLSA